MTLEKDARREVWLTRQAKRAEERRNSASVAGQAARPGTSNHVIRQAETDRLEKHRQALQAEAGEIQRRREDLLDGHGLKGEARAEAERALSVAGRHNRESEIKLTYDPESGLTQFVREGAAGVPLAELPSVEAASVLEGLGDKAKDPKALTAALATATKTLADAQASEEAPLAAGTDLEAQNLDPQAAAARQADVQARENEDQALSEAGRRDLAHLTSVDDALEESRAQQRALLAEIAADRDEDPGTRGERIIASNQAIQNAEQAAENAYQQAMERVVDGFIAGERNYDQAQADSHRLFADHPQRQAEISIRLWGHETEQHAEKPLTDPRHLEDALAVTESVMPPVGSANYEAFDGIRKIAGDIEDQAPAALEAQKEIARLNREIADVRREIAGETDPEERQRLEGPLSEKAEALAEPEGLLSGYAEKAKDLELLRAAGSLSRMVENLGAAEAAGELVDIGGGALRGGAATGAVALLSGNPVTVLFAAAGGALAGASEEFIKSLTTNEVALRGLPALLKENPLRAIELMSEIGTAEQWSKVASYAVSGGSALIKGVKEGAEGLIGAIGEEAAERAIERALD